MATGANDHHEGRASRSSMKRRRPRVAPHQYVIYASAQATLGSVSVS